MENTPKTVVKNTTAAKKTTTARKPKVTVVKPIEEIKTEAPKAASPKEKSTLDKAIEVGKITGSIVGKAGGKILNSSLKTTKTIAGMYSKAGKSAFKIGKELLADTTKVVVSNQKTVRETSAKAFKETVETIKESHIIENPLKVILKNKKTKK
ncbi:hypothetical protein EGI22_00675 [Lacihabitans sp. LS3-19]|uniref:hypothetical protein n=1 Tax=Lacihabitans sp. LS3-19 TaxID=2487335 RepID=UPI0020CF6F7D|nr:hypothetical protein [Lacihabitans sp. LS3-19]MCP9766399.1 hypothetical protein [Lacihabitans sp. LS3-19]